MKKRTFDTTKEAIGRVYETTCCSRRSPTLCLFVDIAWNDSKTRWRKNKRKRGDQPSIVRPVSFIIFLDLVHAVPISSLSPLRSGSRSSSTVTTSRRLTRFLRRVCGGRGRGRWRESVILRVSNKREKREKQFFFWILLVDKNYWRCFFEIAYFWELKIFRSFILGGRGGISFDTWRQMKRYHRWNFCTRIATWIRIFIYNFTKHRIKYILNIDFLIWIGLYFRHWSEFNDNKWKYYF